MYCINENTGEYQILKHRSGMSPFELNCEIVHYMNKYGRYPKLDELEGADSTKAIESDLKVNLNKEFQNKENILSSTNTESVKDAQIKVNDTYRDKEVRMEDFGDSVYMEVENRPNKGVTIDDSITHHSGTILPDAAYFADAIDRLRSLYGFNFKEITNKTLSTNEWLEKVPDGQKASAFIYNGDIYLNIDNLSADAPVHEMLHILFGSMKYSQPRLYDSLVSLSEKIPDYQHELDKYPNRARSDVNEEILVTELGKMITGQDSILDNIDSSTLNEIKYNINRTLDSMVFGKDSVSKLESSELMNSSLKHLALVLDSTKFDGQEAMVARSLNNQKAQLLKSKELLEQCI